MNQGQYYLMHDTWDEILKKYGKADRENKKQKVWRKFKRKQR